LEWRDEYALGVEFMDKTHMEFVEALNKTATLNGAEFEASFARLIEHTKAHFAAEQETMKSLRLSSMREHIDEHDKLLGEMSFFAKKPLMSKNYVTDRLPEWFALHISSMDAALAVAIKERDRALK
jgi:hemerythrin-like metal-binding protein